MNKINIRLILFDWSIDLTDSYLWLHDVAVVIRLMLRRAITAHPSESILIRSVIDIQRRRRRIRKSSPHSLLLLMLLADKVVQGVLLTARETAIIPGSRGPHRSNSSWHSRGPRTGHRGGTAGKRDVTAAGQRSWPIAEGFLFVLPLQPFFFQFLLNFVDFFRQELIIFLLKMVHIRKRIDHYDSTEQSGASIHPINQSINHFPKKM